MPTSQIPFYGMPSLVHKTEILTRTRLDEDPGGLHRAAWVVEAVELLLEAEGLDVDRDLTMAAAWATATIGARFDLDYGDGYGIEDVRRDLGDAVARVVEWLIVPGWQSHQEYLDDLLQHGPQEAKVVALARAMTRVVHVGDDVTEEQNMAMFMFALAVMPGRALAAAGLPVVAPMAEA